MMTTRGGAAGLLMLSVWLVAPNEAACHSGVPHGASAGNGIHHPSALMIPAASLDPRASIERSITPLLDAYQVALKALQITPPTMAANSPAHVVKLNLSREALNLQPGTAAFEWLVHQLHHAVDTALAGRYPAVEYVIEIDDVPLPRYFAYERAMIDAADGNGGKVSPSIASKSVAQRLVAVSPGHGWTNYNGGWNLQRSYQFGIVEDFANSEFVIALNDLLKSRGAATRPTRELDKAAPNGESGRPRWQDSSRNYVKFLGLPESIWNSAATDDYDDDIRVRPLYANWADANGRRADVLVSLHNNGGGGTGTETWYDTANGQQVESKRLADAVHNKIIAAIRAEYDPTWPDRRVKGSAGGYGENRLATRPSILIEVAFMDRKSPDNDAIQDARFRGIVAKAIADGLNDFFAATPDSGPPTTPTILSAKAVSQSQIDLAWAASTDDVGVTGYRVLRDGVQVAETARLTFTDTALTPATTYRYTVAARDAAGNWSMPSVVTEKATTTATPYLGLWWNAAESGWGVSVTQHAETIFVAAFTYDANGVPVWYVMSNCPLSGATCTGDLYRVTGGVAPTLAWSGGALAVARAGTGTLAFRDGNNGTFRFVIDGASGEKAITRQVFATSAAPALVDFTDLWWNAAESGWGISLTHQAGVIFATWFAYDTSGAPVWYVASNCALTGTGINASCAGDLYRVNGGSPLTQPWAGAARVVTRVGDINIAFADASNAVMRYTIDGVAASRSITRQAF
jgi:N-acetylmuramoyl-L-alanine amidase